MQETPKRQTRKKISFGGVAMLLIISALIGQLLGFLRTKLVNANFSSGGPDSTDAYFAAFIIPDLFFYTLAAGALGVAFMPVLSDRLHKGDKKGMWELTSSLLNLLSIVMLAVAVVIFIFAEPDFERLRRLRRFLGLVASLSWVFSGCAVASIGCWADAGTG